MCSGSSLWIDQTKHHLILPVIQQEGIRDCNYKPVEQKTSRIMSMRRRVRESPTR